MSKAEKFIQDCTRNCSNEIIVPTQDGNTYTKCYDLWLTQENALRAVEIAREEVIEKVCKYFKECEYSEVFIKDFKQAMKGE